MAVGNKATKRYDKGDGACSGPLLRSYLFVNNVFLFLGVGVLLGVGVWTLLSPTAMAYPFLAHILLGAGITGIVTASIGCCGITRSDRCFLLVYIFLLLVVFGLQLLVGTLAFLYRGQVTSDLQTSLDKTVKVEYGVDEEQTQRLDDMQRKLHCCGSSSSDDWLHSAWHSQESHRDLKVPDSCCKTESSRCGFRDHPSNIYTTGCIHRLSDAVTNHLTNITIAALGLSILQVIGVIFASCLYVKLRQSSVDL